MFIYGIKKMPVIATMWTFIISNCVTGNDKNSLSMEKQ